MDGRIQSHNSSMPLVSRLDHLDFIMKYLERKQKLAKLGSNGSSGAKLKGQCLPMDLALKETYFKGSLLDRVAALEHRLFQTWIQAAAHHALLRKHQGIPIGAMDPRGESSCSFPTFTSNPYQGHNKRISQVHATRLEIEEQPDGEHPNQNPPTTCSAQNQLTKKKKKKKNQTNKDEKPCPNGKKQTSSNWPYLKLLGC